ncbi:MAG: hypothetical protein CL920_23065 [Deltaproteobacteria bacterium]|nr:hypothetical protein [Deltaproteobacteria bacterium]
MKRSSRFLLGIGSLLLLALSLTSGCAQDLPDINRTQPRALKKTVFRTKNDDGSLREWYFRQTVIEVPYGSGATFVGEQGKTEKIVWEVTEKYLFAHRSREYVKGTDSSAQRPDTGDTPGSAIAAYRVEAHFDIQRAYNPATGEQTNVITENYTDRPWNERKYMRVDFSKNLISDFNFVGSQVSQQPVNFYVPETEVNNKDRAKIGDDYIDLVNKLFIQPEINALYSRYYGRPIPSCWLYTDITKDCLGQTIKIRSSFKLAEDTGYITKQYDNNRMSKFGYFRQTNYAYDRGNGTIEDNTSRVIQRWNIWENERECVQPQLSLSHAKCKVKQIPYYINEQFPEELKEATSKVLDQWNVNFAAVVKSRSGKDQKKVFVFCPNNPVKSGDPEICGKPGLNPQIGDLRYNFVYWVPGPHRSSPLGYGPSAADPVTGEVFNANAFIYGAALDRYSTYATDLVRLVNGDVEGQQLANGQKLLKYFDNMNKLKLTEHAHTHEQLKTGKLTKDLSHLKVIGARLKEKIRDGRASYDWVSSNLKLLSNHPNNAALLSGEPFRAFGLNLLSPSGQVNEKILDQFGPHRMASREFFELASERLKRLSGNNIFMADFVDDGILARALKMKGQFQDANGKIDYKKVLAELRKEIYLGVTLHEFGHNIGLRHNFAASSDALNYHDKYWELRAKTVPNGAAGPLPFYKYSDDQKKLLDNAIKQGMHEYQYSSIMDYGAGFASDLQGLGKYDRAAVLYGYGDLLEVFKQGQTALNSSTVKTEVKSGKWHYTQLPRIVGGQKPITEQIKAFRESARSIVPMKDVASNTKLIEVPYKFCSDEYHHGASNCNRFDQGADPYERVKDITQRYWSYYIFNAFKRGRVEFGMNTRSYLSRIYSRYFLPLTHQYKHFVNDGLIVRSEEKCGDGGAWYTDDRCGQSGFVASVAALNFFSRVIQTPDVGCYEKKEVENRTTFTHVSDGQCERVDGKIKKGFMEIDLGTGRPMLSAFDKASHGYEFYWKPTNYGAWWDKYLAVMALGDPYTRFLGVDQSGNTRSYLINFTNLFGRYVGNIVGGFLAGRADTYGPVADYGGSLLYRQEIGVATQGFNPSPRYNFTTFVDPEEQYTAKLLVGFLASVYFSDATDDQDLNEAMKISVRGLSESPDVPDSIKNDPNRYIEVVDPGSNRVYYASVTTTTRPTFTTGPNAFATGYEILKGIRDKYFQKDGKTLKSGASPEAAHSAFHYVRVLMGWLRAGEYNRPR